MVRSELLQKLCNNHPNFLRKDIEKFLETSFSEIIETLKREENIEIRGFGAYKIKKRNARIGRNPKNSESIKIPEKKAIKWKMSKIFFKKLNNDFTVKEISDNH